MKTIYDIKRNSKFNPITGKFDLSFLLVIEEVEEGKCDGKIICKLPFSTWTEARQKAIEFIGE